jgi:hypothetical protein
VDAIMSADNARIFVSYSHRGNGSEWKARLLRQLAVFERQDLLRYWARVEERTPYRISDTYRSVVDIPEKAQEHLVWLDYLLQITGDDKAPLHLLEGRERLARSSAVRREV